MMKKKLTAKEAKNLAKKYANSQEIQDLVQKELAVIYDVILKVAKDGFYDQSFFISERALHIIAKELISKGYEVETFSLDPKYMKVTWKSNEK